jgi:hypothetical protein
MAEWWQLRPTTREMYVLQRKCEEGPAKRAFRGQLDHCATARQRSAKRQLVGELQVAAHR